MYNHKKIEKKWQKKWNKSGIYQAEDNSKKPKYYVLDMFPYPSGDGLHVGHPKGYIATDILARMKMMQGYNVLHPMGWDAFGLPAENYAIKNKIHPRKAVEKNIKKFKSQLEKIGFTYDWSREINTTDPEFYKITQWMFLQMFKKGLAYESDEPVNWCPSCKTVLANEDLENGKCERCGAKIEKKPLRQWVLKITDYADRLLKGLDDLDWENSIKEMQRNWIGRSEGTEIQFPISNFQFPINFQLSNDQIFKKNTNYLKVFTTRPDTLFGCTYMILSPENSIISKQKAMISNYDEVEKYIKQAKNKSDLDRTDLAKEKTGVELKGIKAINPVNNKEIPIWIADYVLASYGTGAIMAVPAHDERDFEFAKKYNLPIKQVINNVIPAQAGIQKAEKVVLVHGKNTNPTQKWYPWFAKKIEKHGIKFIAPALPEADDPNINAWINEIEKTRPNQDTILIGHSRGGVAILRWLEKLPKNKKVKKVILVAANSGDSKKRNRTENNKGFFTKEGYNFEKIKKHCNDFIVFHSEDDEWVPFEAGEENAKGLNAKFYSFKDKGHFGRKVIEFPELLNEILKQELNEAFTGNGVNVNSGFLDGLKTEEAKKKMIEWLEKNKLGKKAVNYKLRDWVFSRQRYWGEPIPIIKCKNCVLKKLKIKNELNFRVDKIWEQILIKEKSIETRALNPEEPGKYFGNIQEGNLLKLNNKNSGNFEIARVRKVYNFKNLEQLFKRKNLIKKIIPNVDIKSRKDFEKYFNFTKGYINKINKNGLVGFEIELINIIENIPVPEKDLPVKLPDVKNYKPTGTGESPLANIKEWVTVKCPKCGGLAKRETNTMPQWAGSSWYYLAYIMKGISNFQIPISKYKEGFKKWMPVDFYVGGAEHATRHLIYARFWHKFLYDIKVVGNDEPFKKLQHVGLILAEDGRKMSKRWGNVINPDDIVKKYGADSLRIYEMFMGPFSQPVEWNMNGLIGAKRFLDKVYKLRIKADDKANKANVNKQLEILLHQTIKKVTEDIESFDFNTAISQMMILVNAMEKEKNLSMDYYSKFLIFLSPFAPHTTEELWNNMGNKKSIFLEKWPKYNPKFIKEKEIELVIQINGKVRDRIKTPADISEDEAKKISLESEKIKKWIDGKKVKKIIFVKGRLINIVV